MPFRDGAGGRESAALHQQRLHALFDHLPALVGYWDRDARNVLANAAYLEWFGKTSEEVRGLHIRDLLGPEVYAKNLPFITGALNGEEQLFERALVDASGRLRHTQASYVPDVIDGENYGFFVLVTDVTPRVEAQRAMDQAQRLAQLGSWSMNPTTGDISWSEELYRIFGLSRETFVPTVASFLDRVDGRDRESVRAQLESARADGFEYDLTYRILRADGRVREVHSQGRPERGVDGTVLLLAGTLQDVTASNTAARELSRVNAELRKVNQLNADVLAMLGHDVRAPVAVILGYLEELTENWEAITETERRAFLDRARSGAHRLSDLIDDILAVARIDAGSIASAPVVMNVLEHVHQAVELTGTGDTVVVTGEDLQAFADPFHVRQIVANLLTNAHRYGQPPVEVRVGPGNDGYLTITVSDHGPGVPAGQVASLFERFVAGQGQPGEVAQLGASTGFGLYIAAGLAAATNGSLAYEGTASGASFSLVLPCDGVRD